MNGRLALSLLGLAFLPVLGCDKASPVAPNGTILLISAEPAKIGINGTSTITVIGRKPDGQPLNPGTEVRMTTNLGRIEPTIVEIRNGTATATLRGDGRLGIAKVTASTGGSGSSGTPPSEGSPSPPTSGPGSATVDVEVGTPAASIVLQPSPTTLPAVGGRVTLLALVRDSSGQPLANQGVNFTTQLGQLGSRGGIVNTNANGQARDTLTVGPEDLSQGQRSITVTAQTTGGGSGSGGAGGGTSGGLITETFDVQVASDRPSAQFSFTRGSNELTVDFNNESSGSGSLSYNWTFGDGSSSTLESPSHTYAAAGTYTVRLVVTDITTNLSDTETQQITVPVP